MSIPIDIWSIYENVENFCLAERCQWPWRFMRVSRTEMFVCIRWNHVCLISRSASFYLWLAFTIHPAVSVTVLSAVGISSADCKQGRDDVEANSVRYAENSAGCNHSSERQREHQIVGQRRTVPSKGTDWECKRLWWNNLYSRW